MPIPLTQIEEVPERREPLRLVEVAPRAAEPHLVPRALAHLIDVCVVQGLSLYCAKLFSVALVSMHARAIAGTGREAGLLFREAYDYSSMQLFIASLTVVSLLYFVALPSSTGRTPGLGLLGLRVRAAGGEAPSIRQLGRRLLGCFLTYASFGALCLVGLRDRSGRFLQDILSGTVVTRD